MRALALLGAGLALGLLAAPLLATGLRRLGLARVNHAGQRIATAGGLLFLLPALVALAWIPGPASAPALAALVFGVLGLADDRWGTPEFKGLRGHLRALRARRLTTGMLKLAGGLLAAVALAWWLRPGLPALPAALLIALGANLFNLLDLRPLRALKLFWPLGAALAAGGAPALLPLLGASVPYARLESRRTVMLGDTGSNALGAAVGVAAAQVLPVWAQVVAGALAAGFHLWAEKYSLSRWIDARPWAARIDRWGWAAQAEGAAPPES